MAGARLQVGDLTNCFRCGGWHPAVQTDPASAMDYVARMLFDRCPKVGGWFYVGRIGEPPRDAARWRPAPPSAG
jgi:hypothetical protein